AGKNTRAKPATENSDGQTGGPEAPRGESCSGGMRLKNRSRPRESRHTLIMPVESDGGTQSVTLPAKLKKSEDAISRGLWRYQKTIVGGRSDDRRCQRARDVSCS